MKACKVKVADGIFFSLIGLPQCYDVIGAEYEGNGVFILTISGTADDMPEVKDGEPIPYREVRLTKQGARIEAVIK